MITANPRPAPRSPFSSRDRSRVKKENCPMSLAQLHSEKLLAGLLPKPLPLSLIISVSLLSTLWASAAEPLGATPHSDGSTTFRVWAPFVDAVAVKVNGGTAVLLASEDGHPDPADATWVGTVPGAKVGDKYRYVIQRGGVMREFNDPRTRQLTGFELPNGFGLAGNDNKPQSVIVDPNFSMPAFTVPTFNMMGNLEQYSLSAISALAERRLQRSCRGESPIGARFDAWPASARSFARCHTDSTRERTQAGAAAIRSS